MGVGQQGVGLRPCRPAVSQILKMALADFLSMKPGALAVMCLVLAAIFSTGASADYFTGDVHTTVTVFGQDYWSGIQVNNGEILEYKLTVTGGAAVNVYLIDDSDLTSALMGGQVVQLRKDENTRSVSQSYPAAGKYALVITNGLTTSVCKIDITVRQANFFEANPGCVFILIIFIVIAVAVVVAVVRRRRRARMAVPRQGFGVSRPDARQYGQPPPVPQYGPPTSPAPGYGTGPPPNYLPPAVPAYRQEPAQPYYDRPPARTGYQAPPQAPAAAPQAPLSPPVPPGPPAMAGGTVSCKYCMMEVPAGVTVCPRCGGFM